MKTLFYLGNESIAHSAQLFARVVENRCSKVIRNVKGDRLVLYNVQHIFHEDRMAASKISISEFYETVL